MANETITDPRQLRGLELAKRGRIKHVVGDKWRVPSASGAGYYVVDASADNPGCDCADFETRRPQRCKHQWALAYARHTVRAPDGTVLVTETVKITYGQDWGPYNMAQDREREHVEQLLRDLCSGLVTPPHDGRGPKPIPLADVVFGMATKVYTGFSARRVGTDIRSAVKNGLMKRAPRKSSMLAAFNRAELTPVLTRLIEQSAAPLAAVETKFAIDSTGFTTVVYRRWCEHGKKMKKLKWVKAHAMVGVSTNIVTAVHVTVGTAADEPELPELVETTARTFTIDEASADRAYLSHANLRAIEAAGGQPYIPFKVNSTQGQPNTAWRKMMGLFLFRNAEFMDCLHKRSRVESVFGALKKKQGASLRSRQFTAQVNEVLCKVLVYNLGMLVHAMYELGIAPQLAPRAA